MSEEMKVCARCKRSKPLDEYFTSTSSDGEAMVYEACATCCAKQTGAGARDWREARKRSASLSARRSGKPKPATPREAHIVQNKLCMMCKEKKPIHRFPWDHKAGWRRSALCSTCLINHGRSEVRIRHESIKAQYNRISDEWAITIKDRRFDLHCYVCRRTFHLWGMRGWKKFKAARAGKNIMCDSPECRKGHMQIIRDKAKKKGL